MDTNETNVPVPGDNTTHSNQIEGSVSSIETLVCEENPWEPDIVKNFMTPHQPQKKLLSLWHIRQPGNIQRYNEDYNDAVETPQIAPDQLRRSKLILAKRAWKTRTTGSTQSMKNMTL